MDRLSTLDAAFLRIESSAAHMHVGWLAIAQLEPGQEHLDVGRLWSQVESRLSLVPRFRQRVAPAPLGLGEAVWVDHQGFRLVDHIHVHDSDPDGEPIGAEALREVVDAFLSRPLPRSRPLWELLVAPRVEGGLAAIAGKVHHAMVDGLAAVELGTLLFDVDPDRAEAAPARWIPQAPPSGTRLLAETVTDEAVGQLRNARNAARLGLAPGRAVRIADSVRRAALSFAEDYTFPAPSSDLNVTIGPRRVLRTTGIDMARALRIKRRADAKLNDIVLTIVAGALNRHATDVGATPIALRAFVPVSVRDSDSGALGNRIALGLVGLPVDEPEPLRRLELARAAMDELKRSGRVGGSDVLLRGLAPFPGAVKDRAARLAASPRLYNLVVSNVPGPRAPLYAAGARLVEIAPVIPLSEDHALAVGILTYTDRLQIAFHADPDALPTADALPAHALAATAELERALQLRSPQKQLGRSSSRRLGEARRPNAPA